MEDQIGAKIRRLRRRRNLTLQATAEKSGLTKGYLSKVERGLKSPPIATLSRIAQALNADMAEFFERSDDGRKCTIVRRDERKPVNLDGQLFGYHYEALAYRYHRKMMEPFLITLTPNATDRTIFSHEGEEMMIVLEGRMLFYFGDERHVCDEGDCIYFDSGVPHRGECVGDWEAKVLVVIYSPREGLA